MSKGKNLKSLNPLGQFQGIKRALTIILLSIPTIKSASSGSTPGSSASHPAGTNDAPHSSNSSSSSGSSGSGSSSSSSSASNSTETSPLMQYHPKYIKITQMFNAINDVRKNPSKWVDKIDATYIKKMDKDNVTHTDWKRKFKEGIPAMKEAENFLKNAKPVPELKLNVGMSYAAFKHSVYMLKKGKLDHTGKGGSSMSNRLEEYGDWETTIGENILKTINDTRTPEVIVMEWLIDDGVKNRGHRQNLLKKDFKVIGIGIAHNAKDDQDWITVDLSGGFNCKKCSKLTAVNAKEMGWDGPMPSSHSSGSYGNVLGKVLLLALFGGFLLGF